MAKYPFAEIVRKNMEASGVVILPDGSTTLKKPNDDGDKTPQQENITTETTSVPDSTDSTVPDEGNTNQILDGKDKILALQREEIAELKGKLAQVEPLQSSEKQLTKSAREAELEKEIEDLRAKISTQTTEEQVDEVRSLLEQQGFDSEVLDDEALLDIRDRLIKPVADKLEHLENTIRKYEEKVREPTPEEKLASIKQDTNKKLVDEIPDFHTIFNSKDFQKRLSEKDNRFPTKTYGEALQIAYENGNADFIVQEVKNFLSGGPAQTISDIADVSASKGVGGNDKQQPSKSKYTFTYEEAMQMLRSRQRGDISRQEYSEYRQKLEKHRSGS